MFYHKMFGLLAEFEHNLKIESAKTGLEAARKRGEILVPSRGLYKKAENENTCSTILKRKLIVRNT